MLLQAISGLAALALLASACGGGQGGNAGASVTSVALLSTTTPLTTTAPTVPVTTTTSAPTVPAPTAPPTTATAATTTVTSSTTSAAPAQCAALPSGVTITTIEAGGAIHDLRIFVPPAHSGSDVLPAVLDWHGYNQDGATQAALSGFETLAETEGFMVVHPTGVPNPGRNANAWELDPARDPNRDDLVFAGALIDELIVSWCADPARIYSTGMSDGGFFTSILVCEMADRIAAATSVAGVMRTPDCQPSRTVPYYAFHGTDDPIEPFDKDLAAFDDFAAGAGCEERKWIDFTKEVVLQQYMKCPMTFFQIQGGGHSWPGSPVADQQPTSLGYTTMDIDATAVSWELFKSVELVQ